MTLVGNAAGAFAIGALALQLLSCMLAVRSCRRRKAPRPSRERPPVSLVRPVCGIDYDAERTLGSSFTLDHPDYEVIFCASDPDDPVLALLDMLRRRHPQVRCRILVGRGDYPFNPKLDNCAKGWEAAANDWIVLADSNIVLPPDYLARIVAAEDAGVGLVSGPPVGGDAQGFWAEVECAVLNTYQARIQYAVDALGKGFAQGKTLSLRKSTLARAGGYPALANEPAEDAAATKAIRSLGLRVRLAAPPCIQPLGRRRWQDVWGRQLRWARLRRVTFPLLFFPEILSGGLLPTLGAIAWAMSADVPVWPSALVWLAIWYGAEAGLAVSAGWSLRWTSPAAWLLRDLAIPAIWAAAWTGRSISWRGSRIDVGRAGERDAMMTITTQFAVDCDGRPEGATRLGGGVW